MDTDATDFHGLQEDARPKTQDIEQEEGK